MKNILLRVLRLYAGLFTYAIGIVFTINANLGLSPWDVFSKGLSIKCHITMGHAYIFVGFVLVIVDAVLGERLGWGTILNMIFIGVFMDFLMLNHLIPISHSMALRIIMMLLGMFIIGIATYLYIGAGLGSGPRDGLMLALTKKTRKSVRLIRTFIETSALVTGYILGGYVGMGTLIMALTTGYFVQAAFRVFKFDVKAVKHRFIDEDIKFLRDKLFKTKKIISIGEDESQN